MGSRVGCQLKSHLEPERREGTQPGDKRAGPRQAAKHTETTPSLHLSICRMVEIPEGTSREAMGECES